MMYYVFNPDLSYADYLKSKKDVEIEGTSAPQILLEVPKTTLELIADETCLEENRIKKLTKPDGETGRIRISYQLRDVKSKHSELNADFHWGFANKIIQIGHFHDGIDQIFPQPDKADHIKAFRNFKIALELFNKGDYAKALSEVNIAINGDSSTGGNKKEWRFQFLSGIIHLGFYDCDTALVDLPAAVTDFLRAANLSAIDYKHESAIALAAAGWASYCNGNTSDAKKYTSEAFKLNSKLSEAYYLLGKFNVSEGNVAEGLEHLNQAITKDTFYSLKAASDETYLAHEKELNTSLERIKKVILESFRSQISTDILSLDSTDKNPELKQAIEGFKKDRHLLEINKLEKEWHKFKSYPVFISKPVEKLKIAHEALVKVVEPYKEKVIFREKSLFRKEESKLVTKTRVVEKMKKTIYEVNIFRDQFIFFTGKVLTEYDMVQVDGAKYNMGDTGGVGRSDELPIQEVELDTYLISKMLVTQKLWNLVMDTNPSNFHGYELPVEHISWYECVEFCNKLSKMAGLTPCYTIDKKTREPSNVNKTDTIAWAVTCNWDANGYRLPTEAEWEYAAKGGSNSNFYKYAGSETESPVAWHKNNSQYKTQNVGQKKPNELGLYDMSGNVWEWCWDWYDDYSGNPLNNPTGAEKGSYRVLRGGSWADNQNYPRVSSRGKENPSGRYSSIGMRFVRKAR